MTCIPQIAAVATSTESASPSTRFGAVGFETNKHVNEDDDQ